MSDAPRATRARHQAHRNLALKLGLVALGAFGFGFALVPLYDVLCAVTGYGDRKELTREAAMPTPRR